MITSFVSKNKKILFWASIIIIALGAGFWTYDRFFAEKSLKLISLQGKEVLRAGKTYQIIWKQRGLGKIGITLTKGDSKETFWLAKDIPADDRVYNWQVFAWQEPRQDYKISIFEYPWQEGKFIDSSQKPFTVLGPQFASCDSLSIRNEWPFLPSDFPGLRKVFVSQRGFSGNLEGLEGADLKCQTEAQQAGFGGNWKAFLGSDQTLATDRLNLTGVFVEAVSAGSLPEQKSCHRLFGRNFDEFFKKLSNPLLLNQDKFDIDWLKSLANVWLGRINKESKRECSIISAQYPSLDPSRNYSFTTTCQNWSSDKETLFGYPPKEGQRAEFPVCYTGKGVRIQAVGVAGLASGLTITENRESFTPSLGKSCNEARRLICVEQ